MSKKNTNPFDKLDTTDTIETPIQKVVPINEPVKKRKRDNEQSYTLYLHKNLLKQLKEMAFHQDTNVKELIETAIIKQYKIKK